MRRQKERLIRLQSDDPLNVFLVEGRVTALDECRTRNQPFPAQSDYRRHGRLQSKAQFTSQACSLHVYSSSQKQITDILTDCP